MEHSESIQTRNLRGEALKTLLNLVVLTLDAGLHEEWKILNEAHKQFHILTCRKEMEIFAKRENIELDDLDKEFLEVYLSAPPDKQSAMLALVKEAGEKYKRH